MRKSRAERDRARFSRSNSRRLSPERAQRSFARPVHEKNDLCLPTHAPTHTQRARTHTRTLARSDVHTLTPTHSPALPGPSTVTTDHTQLFLAHTASTEAFLGGGRRKTVPGRRRVRRRRKEGSATARRAPKGQNDRHAGFARGHPPYYWPRLNPLNFLDLTG